MVQGITWATPYQRQGKHVCCREFSSISTRVSPQDHNANFHTDAVNVQGMVTLQQTVGKEQLSKLVQQVPQQTPVKPDCLTQLLQGHPNQPLVNEVVNGFRNSFSLKYNGPHNGRIHCNLKSAFQFPKQLQQCLDKEVNLGRMLGPFQQQLLDNLICSPVGMVLKKDSDKMRMITHLSYPHGDSINSHMDPKDMSTSYQSFDQALAIVAKYSKAAYMSKGDVESAFRIVPIAPQDWHLLGIQFNRCFYIDICFPFRASISCTIFKNIGNLLQWIAQHRAKHPISRYLDDFFTAHILQQVCDSIMQTIHDTCSEVGVLMSPTKRVYATQIIEFLGLLIDTLLMIVRVPTDKQRDILQHIVNILKSEQQTVASLQSLAGKLNFIAKAFPLGRPFIRSLYMAATGKHPKRSVQIDDVMRQD